jgi:RecB family exonuclease
VIDYKSGPTTSPEQAVCSRQLSIYALACRDALALGRPERVTLYCVEQSRRLRAERTDATPDALRSDLAARAPAIRASDFAPTPSPRSCGWCDLTTSCRVNGQ